MNAEDFEKHLREQSMRQIPAEWRKEILTAARPTTTPDHPLISNFRFQISNFLRPRPVAWAGLAAIWVVILILNVSGGSDGRQAARRSPSQSSQAIAALREQQRLMSELAGRRPGQDADRPKVAIPQPRSQRRQTFSIV